MKTRNSPSHRSSPPSPPRHEDIAARAKILWERRGRPQGLDDAIWFEAERHLTNPALARADDERFANRDALLTPDGDPNDDVDDRLREVAAPSGQRSATSL